MNMFFAGDSSYFLDLYAKYRRDPASVPQDWRLHFEGFRGEDGGRQVVASVPVGVGDVVAEAFREYGYKESDVDPLGLMPRGHSKRLDTARALAGNGNLQLHIGGVEKQLSSAAAIAELCRLYTGTASLQAAHVYDPESRDWLYETYETELSRTPDQAVLARTLEAVLLADEFEKTVKAKWPTKKRFGSEGSESSMVLLHEAFRAAHLSGYREAVIGGMHRGRLASLATVFGKSLPALVAEIKGADVTDGDDRFTSDVPYHNGLLASVSILTAMLLKCGFCRIRHT